MRRGMVQCFNIPAVLMAAACGATLGAAAGAARASTQNVTIEAVDANGAAVSEAVCDIANRQGAWRVVTPVVAQITAGGEWLKVKCAKGFGLAGASTSIDTTQLSPPRANPMPGTLRQLGGTPAVKVRVVMRDTAGAAPALPATSESQIVRAMPVPAPSFVGKLLAVITMSKSGGWGFGVRGSDPRKMALDNCERRGGPCEIYAFNQQVVLAFTDTE